MGVGSGAEKGAECTAVTGGTDGIVRQAASCVSGDVSNIHAASSCLWVRCFMLGAVTAGIDGARRNMLSGAGKHP